MQEQTTTVTDQFIQAIHDTIFEVYKKCYIGHLRIHRLPGGAIDLVLGFNAPENPIHICAQLDDESFLKYLKQELHNRRLTDIKFYTGYKTDMFEPHMAQPIDHGRHHANDSDLVSDGEH